MSIIQSNFYSNISYEASGLWAAKTVAAAADRYTLTSPKDMQIDVGGVSLTNTVLQELDLSVAATWDTISGTDYTVAASRAGLDFYAYSCVGASTVPVIKISANATYPSGYTANTSRKVGGFHCLCVAAGTISGHPADGYLAGDIIPNSVWCLKHRSASGSNVDGIR